MELELTDEKIRKLAENPNNVVYAHVEQPRLPEIVPIEQVEASIKTVFDRFCSMRDVARRRRGKGEFVQADYEAIIAILKREESLYRTHPLFFMQLTQMTATKEDYNLCMEMIEIFVKTQGSQAGKVLLAKRVMDVKAKTKAEWDALYVEKPVNLPLR